MTPDQISLVKTSFDSVKPISDDVAALFYGHLFEIAPEVKPLFSTDTKEQGRKLMAALNMVVSGLEKLEAILPAVQAMALRHVDYGVTSDQYAIVGEALIWALSRALGPDFTEEVETAWLEAYTILANAMVAYAYPSEEDVAKAS